MKPGEPVLLFTASGTFRGHRGWVAKPMRGGAMVRVEGESVPMYFTVGEIVRERDDRHAGAE